jgi:hypothetical protein
MELWRRGNKFVQVAVWWVRPGDDRLSEIVLPCHTQQLCSYGHISPGSQMIKPLVMQPYSASDTIPARPGYSLWPIWPYISSVTVCREHGGIVYAMIPPHMATHFSISASLSTMMSMAFTDKKG